MSQQFIFSLMQSEIDALDSQIQSLYSPLLKSYRQAHYSAYLDCLSPHKSQSLTPEIHQQCLNQAQSLTHPLSPAFPEINSSKDQLYECLNRVHTKNASENSENEVRKCLGEFKTQVLSIFAKIKA